VVQHKQSNKIQKSERNGWLDVDGWHGGNGRLKVYGWHGGNGWLEVYWWHGRNGWLDVDRQHSRNGHNLKVYIDVAITCDDVALFACVAEMVKKVEVGSWCVGEGKIGGYGWRKKLDGNFEKAGRA
jgi:hypothetical protein